MVLCRDGRGNERPHCGSIVPPQAGGGVIEQYPTIRGWGVIVTTSAVKRSIGSTTSFHNHGEGPY